MQLRGALVLAISAWVLACSSSEPRSALILSDETANPVGGIRELNASQTRALRNVITSAGEQCASIERAYLRDVDTVARAESWEVRCVEAPYAVVIRADGTPSDVRPCVGSSVEASPCMQPSARRPRNRTPGALNPDLGKLLEPMTGKDGKTD